MNSIIIVIICSLVVVICRRLILKLIDKYRIVQFSNGFSAGYILGFSSLLIVYFVTGNIQLTLIAFLLTQIMRFIFRKLFFMFPTTNIINDIGLFIWTFIIVYLSKQHKNLTLDIRKLKYN
jgi:hypothetical protein